MNFDERIEEMFIDLPEPLPAEDGISYTSKSGKLLFVTGQLPYSEGRSDYKGRVGLELSLDAGTAAARGALIRALGVLKSDLGSLNKIKRIVNVKLYIATGAEFREHRKVLAAVTQLTQNIFGSFGNCSADVLGCASLPEGAAAELSMVVEVR